MRKATLFLTTTLVVASATAQPFGYRNSYAGGGMGMIDSTYKAAFENPLAFDSESGGKLDRIELNLDINAQRQFATQRTEREIWKTYLTLRNARAQAPENQKADFSRKLEKIALELSDLGTKLDKLETEELALSRQARKVTRGKDWVTLSMEESDRINAFLKCGKDETVVRQIPFYEDEFMGTQFACLNNSGHVQKISNAVLSEENKKEYIPIFVTIPDFSQKPKVKGLKTYSVTKGKQDLVLEVEFNEDFTIQKVYSSGEVFSETRTSTKPLGSEFPFQNVNESGAKKPATPTKK